MPKLQLGNRLAPVSTNVIAGLIETVAAPPYHGKADLPELARNLQLEIGELFPVAEILHRLGFVEINEDDIALNAAARNFAEFDTRIRKEIFAHRLRTAGSAYQARARRASGPSGRDVQPGRP